MIRRITCAVLVPGIAAIGFAACGSSTERPSGAASQRRAETDAAIARLIETSKQALCVRYIEPDPPVVIAGTKGTAAIFKREAARRALNVRVKIETVAEINADAANIAGRVKRMRPAALSSVDVYPEIYSGHLRCPRAHIELGVRGAVSPELSKWAAAMIRTFGAAWLELRYIAKGKAV